MKNNIVIEGLKNVLADSYTLYLKTQNYHWNVTGPNFKALHDLFEEQYTELATAIDDIAERIRTLGDKAPGTWKAYEKLTQIKPGDENANAEDMIKDLANSQTIMVDTLSKVLDFAQVVDDEVTTSLITDRMDVHEKNNWLLSSSL